MATLNEVFETLRALAEADTTGAGTVKRRPSWAPALVLDDDKIIAKLADVGLPVDEKVAGLWATFAGPDKVSTLLRTKVSTLPMPEARVRAFELCLGVKRSRRWLLKATRGRDGAWGTRTPTWFPFPQWAEYRLAERARVELAMERRTSSVTPPGAQARLDAAYEKVATYKAALDDHHDRGIRRGPELGELIKQRVAEFAGDPRAQMIAGARVTGNCAICGRGLTDPVSLERGIGPECFQAIAPGLRAHVAQREAAA